MIDVNMPEVKLIYKNGRAHFQLSSTRFQVSIREDLYYGPALLAILAQFNAKKKKIRHTYDSHLLELKRLNIKKFKVDQYEYSTGYFNPYEYNVSRCIYRPYMKNSASPLEEMTRLNDLVRLETQGQIACCKAIARYFHLQSMLFVICDYLEHIVRAVCFACIPSNYKFPDYYVLYLKGFGYVAHTNPKTKFNTFAVIDITQMFNDYFESMHGPK